MSDGTTETVVGHVPASWPIYTLESLAAFITKGGTPTTYGHDWADASTGIPFFRSECVTDNGFDPKGMNFISPAAHQQMVRSEVKPGDLLMTITGNVGRVAKSPEEFPTANINQHIARIRVLGTSDADADYVYHCLKHDGYAAYYRGILTGQAYPQISLQQVRETPVALPPVAERRKIAAILTAMDDKLDVIARQIEATQTLKQGLMQTLFSRGVGSQDADGRWIPHAEFKDSELGRIPQSWTVCRLQEVSEFITKGGTPTTYGFNWANAEEGIPFFRSECVTEKGFNPKGMNFIQHDAHRLMARSEVRPGDILMTITGNIGRVARAPIEYATANINQHIARIRIGNGNAEFFYQCLQQESYSKHYGAILTGQAYPQISLKQVRETPIVFPPLFEQKRIALILADADAKASLLGKRLLDYQTLRRGLMQKLLTGEWRVKLDAEMAA